LFSGQWSLSVVGLELSPPVLALLDSGCEHVLAAPWVAAAAGVDPRDSQKELYLGLGGDSVRVRFLDLRLRLHPPGGENDDVFVEWEDEVGFLSQWRPTWPLIVGQTGFMKWFTVTMSRLAQAVAVDDANAFDHRHRPPLAR